MYLSRRLTSKFDDAKSQGSNDSLMDESASAAIEWLDSNK